MLPLVASASIALLILLLYSVRLFWRFAKPKRIVLLEHHRGVLYEKGRMSRVLEPGIYWTSVRRQIVPVDIRRQLQQIPGQEVLTSDGIAVKLSAVLEYAITDPEKMLRSSTGFVALVYSQAQLNLRTAVGEMTVDALLAARETISLRFQALLAPVLVDYGAELHSARVLDIMLPSDVRRAYAESVTAQKKGLAQLERARGETASLRSLANAARLMQDHPGLLQLRAVQAIEASKGSTTLELKIADPLNTREEANS